MVLAGPETVELEKVAEFVLEETQHRAQIVPTTDLVGERGASLFGGLAGKAIGTLS